MHVCISERDDEKYGENLRLLDEFAEAGGFLHGAHSGFFAFIEFGQEEHPLFDEESLYFLP